MLTISLDALITIEALLVALLFRFDAQVPEVFWIRFWPFAAFSALVFVVLLLVGRAYRVTTSREVATATATCAVIATGLLVLVNLGIALVWTRPVPLSVILVGGMLALVQLVAMRLYARAFSERSGA